MAKRSSPPAPSPIVRRSSLKNRVISLILTIIGVFFVAAGMKNSPGQVSAFTVVGIVLILVSIVFRLIKPKATK